MEPFGTLLICAITVKSNLLVVGVGVLGVEGLVGPHDRHEVLGVGKVGDGVRVAGDHLDHAHVATGDGVLVDREWVPVGVLPHFSQPDGSRAGDDQELLPLGHVPVIALGDAGPGDVDGDLAAVGRAQELGEGAALVYFGFKVVGEITGLAVAQERRVKLLGERAIREVGYVAACAGVPKRPEQVDNLAERLDVGLGDVAEAGALDTIEPLVAAAVLLSQERPHHLCDKIVDVEEFELDRGVVHGVRTAVSDGVAEGRDSGVVARAAPLSVEVREAVDEDGRARALGVVAEEPLPRELTLPIDRALEAARQARLSGAGEHHGAPVAVGLEAAEKLRGEPEVPLHELGLVLGAVHAGEVEDEIGAGAVFVQFLGRRVDVVFHDLEGKEGLIPLAAILAVADVPQRAAEVPSYEPLRAGNEDAHPTAPPRARGPRGPAARTRRS